jgi:glutamate 5-kinase
MYSDDLRKPMGLKSAEIPAVLPDWSGAEVVHRDHLVLL